MPPDLVRSLLDLLAAKLSLPARHPARPFADVVRARVAEHYAQRVVASELCRQAIAAAHSLPGVQRAEVLARGGAVLERLRPEEGVPFFREAIALLETGPDMWALVSWLKAAASTANPDPESAARALALIADLDLESRAMALALAAPSLRPLSQADAALRFARASLSCRKIDLESLASICFTILELSPDGVVRDDARRVLAILAEAPGLVHEGLPEPVLSVLVTLGRAGHAEILELAQRVGERERLGLRVVAVNLLARLELRDEGQDHLAGLMDDLATSMERLEFVDGELRPWASPTLLAQVIPLVSVLEPDMLAVDILTRYTQWALTQSSSTLHSVLVACVQAAARLDDAELVLDYVTNHVVAPLDAVSLELSGVVNAAIATLASTAAPGARPLVDRLARGAARRAAVRDGDPFVWALPAVRGWSALQTLGAQDLALQLLDDVIALLPDLQVNDRLMLMRRLVEEGRSLDHVGRMGLLDRLPLPTRDRPSGRADAIDTADDMRALVRAIESSLIS